MSAQDDADVAEERAWALYRERRFGEALPLFEQAAQTDPGQGRLAFSSPRCTGGAWARTESPRNASSGHLAGAHVEAGNAREERRWLEHAASLGNPLAMYYLGRALDAGRWGVTDRERAFARSPKEPCLSAGASGTSSA